MQRFSFERKGSSDNPGFRVSNKMFVLLTIVIMIVAVVVMQLCKGEGQQYSFSDYFDVFNTVFWIMIAAKCVSFFSELKSEV